MTDGIPADITFHINVKLHDCGLTTATVPPRPTKTPSVCWKMEFRQWIVANLCNFKASRLKCYKIPASLELY